MITRKTTIDRHIGGNPATGLRMMQAHDVVTEYAELDADDPADQRWVDEVHEARVALEQLDVEPRQRAYDWLAAHDHDHTDDVAAYRAAIAAATGLSAAAELDRTMTAMQPAIDAINDGMARTGNKPTA